MIIIKRAIKRGVLLLNNNLNEMPCIGTVVLPYRVAQLMNSKVSYNSTELRYITKQRRPFEMFQLA